MNRPGSRKASVTLVYGRALQPAHPFLHAAARLGDDLVLAGLDPLHIDVELAANLKTVFAAARGKARGVGARHHGLGGRAAVVHAGAAELVALDHRDFHSRASEARSEGGTSLAGADDDGVEAGRHASQLSARPSDFHAVEDARTECNARGL